jgi:hypothetical protein
MTIKARDDKNNIITDYTNTIDITIEKKLRSSRYTASSSTYRITESYDDNYDFTSSDNGQKKFHEYIYFKTSGTYRILIKDNDENIQEYSREINV